jgi:hypothetical protein
LKSQFAKEPYAIDATAYNQGRDLPPATHDLNLLLSVHRGNGSAMVFFKGAASFGVLADQLAFTLPE